MDDIEPSSTPSFVGKLADPSWRSARARKAAQDRTSIDHHIQQVVDNAPDLSPDQLARLRRVVEARHEDKEGA